MKVLFCVRHNFYDSPGGAQIQILKTKEYIERQGIKCDITTTPYGVNYNKYDIVHLTDLTWVYDLILYLEELKGYNVKKVLSTIYWPFDDYAANGSPFLQRLIYKTFGINGFEFAKALGKLFLKKEKIYFQGLKNSYLKNQVNILNKVDWLLPNSKLEIDALNERLNLKLTNFSVVNNAIDIRHFNKILNKKKIEKNNNLITFVARIDPRKNQLNFLRALKNTQYKIRFIGNPGPNCLGYFEKLKNEAKERGNVEFISHISQEEVFKNMIEAKVNVLTSWIETPGLVSIEAAYAGCNIVVTDKGSVRDYFHDYAYYCEPDNLESIKEQVELALSKKFNKNFKNFIIDNYDWNNAAGQTIDAYKKVLNV